MNSPPNKEFTWKKWPDEIGKPPQDIIFLDNSLYTWIEINPYIINTLFFKKFNPLNKHIYEKTLDISPLR